MTHARLGVCARRTRHSVKARDGSRAVPSHRVGAVRRFYGALKAPNCRRWPADPFGTAVDWIRFGQLLRRERVSGTPRSGSSAPSSLFKKITQPDEGRYSQNRQHHQRDLDVIHPLAIPRTVAEIYRNRRCWWQRELGWDDPLPGGVGVLEDVHRDDLGAFRRARHTHTGIVATQSRRRQWGLLSSR